ncbi:uncharacterized protein TNCV_37221 [Trichonephila clavipes]|nr:uncharacterized protein TNCV_37221 [Trichonephila clavipes]
MSKIENRKKIQEIKTNNNISYIEAKKLIPPQLSQTYVQATKSSPISVTTQTDENITKIKCPPLNLLTPLSSPPKPNISLYSPAVTKSSSSQAQLLPSISSMASTISDPQPPTPMSLSLSDAKEKTKEQPSQAHGHRKDSKKIDLQNIKPTTNSKKTSDKNTSLKIAREEDSLYESTPVSKRSRRRKTFQASDDMDTDFVTDLASEEYESLFEG